MSRAHWRMRTVARTEAEAAPQEPCAPTREVSEAPLCNASTDWKALTRRANTAFAAGDLGAARPDYEAALELVVHRIAVAKSAAKQLVTMVVAGAANLAELHRRRRATNAAIAAIRAGLDALQQVLDDTAVAPELAADALRGVGQLVAEYAGLRPDCSREDIAKELEPLLRAAQHCARMLASPHRH